MPKLERLIELARLKRGGASMTVRELGEACGVSERTVYRYLHTLSEINVNKVLKKPSPGSLKNRLMQLELTRDDLVLVEYALRQSELAVYPCLARRFRKACRCLTLAVEQRADTDNICLIKPTSAVPRKRGDVNGPVVDKFLRAGKLGRNLRVVLKRASGRVMVLTPVRLYLAGNKLLLSFVNPEKAQTISLSPGQVRSMTMVRSR